MFDVYPFSPSIAGRVWEFDVVYFKDYRTLMDRDDRSQLRRRLVALCGYRFFSEAHFIVEARRDETIWDESEAKTLLDASLRGITNQLDSFGMVAERWHDVAGRLAEDRDLFQLSATLYATSDGLEAIPRSLRPWLVADASA